MAVVDANEQLAVTHCLAHQTLFDGGIVLHRAVTINMVGRQIEQQCFVGRERWSEIDLKGRDLQHIDGFRVWRIECKYRLAYVAADLSVEPASPQNVSDQRGRRRLSVGPRNGDDRRVASLAAIRPDLAGEEFKIADDRDSERLRPFDNLVRFGMGKRNTG